MTPDLNIDLGELPGEPDELYRLAHRVNIACGGHAGDAASMRHACAQARAAGARVGAHPSFPDRAHFGRAAMAIAPDVLAVSLAEQCAALHEIAQASGVRIVHLKPHGALYHAANADHALARVVVECAQRIVGPVEIVGPPSGELRRAAVEAGLPFLAEGFADRGLAPDGTLLPRGAPGSVLADPLAAAMQALRLASGGGVQTICVHADTPNAVEIARAVRAALEGSIHPDAADQPTRP